MGEILTPEALAFRRKNRPRIPTTTRAKLLAKRVDRQQEIDNGIMPDFSRPPNPSAIDKSWRVASIPADLQDRRTEILPGQSDRKMVIQRPFNSGAKVFMADFEDATLAHLGKSSCEGPGQSPRRRPPHHSFSNPDGKQYRLKRKKPPTLPRPARAVGICR